LPVDRIQCSKLTTCALHTENSLLRFPLAAGTNDEMRETSSDALVSRSWTVRHILSSAPADPHQLTAFAKLDEGLLTYPAPGSSAPDGTEPQPRLFP